MDIIEIIKNRRSCRTFTSEELNKNDKAELEKYIKENALGLKKESIPFKIIEKEDKDIPLKINYGMIQGHKTYVLGSSLSNSDSRINYGYLMEKIVLKASEFNISSCWVGYFDPNYFKEINIKKGYEIPSILILGYAEKQSVGERLVRMTIKANKRNDWETMFFDLNTKSPLDPKQIPAYADALEMLRLSPSSGNTQPWKVFYDKEAREFHFFKKIINKRYNEMGLHEIDMGIAMAHFELTSTYKGLSGTWHKQEKKINGIPDDLHYIWTWKCAAMQG
ncbi:MAG: hypothetical protein JW857_00195 [Bacteroidales bacterium]|nr:hypothetical protein [Bacteroidales bacterium]